MRREAPIQRANASAMLPATETLHAILKYDAETGKLFWKERPVSMFRSDARWTAEQACRRWNSRWSGKEAFTSKMKTGHKQGAIFNKLFLAHRVAFKMWHGFEASGEIDHINGNAADNRIENLRDVSHQENMMNVRLRAGSKSGVIGVTYDSLRNRWKATIAGKHIGRFDSIADAAAARASYEASLGYHPNHGRRQ